MTEHGGPHTVHQELDRLAGMEQRTVTARHRYIRRYLLGLGGAYAGWLLALQLTERWLAHSSLARAVVIGLAVGLLFAAVLAPAHAEPVRVRLGSRFRLVLVLGCAVGLGVPAAFARDYWIAAPVGAVLMLGFSAFMAWWATRDR